MGLTGLGGLGPEAVDEGFQASAFSLLLLETQLLLTQLLGALALEGGVVTGIQARMTSLQVQHVGADAVEKLTVVTDQQQGTGIFQQPLFEPEHGIQIQMVGGLVQQQEIAGGHQGPGQIEPDPPAAGKGRYRVLVNRRSKTQAVQQSSGSRPGVVATQFFQTLVGMGHGLVVFPRQGVRFGLEGSSHLGISSQHEIQGSIGHRRGFLGHGSNAQARRHLQFARIGIQFTFESSKQAGLATAIAPDHTQAPTGMDGEVHFCKQQARTTPQGKIAE